MSRDRLDRVLIGLAVALLLIATLFAAPRGMQDNNDRRASTYHSISGGTRALYLLLEELEIPVERRHTPLTREPTGALALLAPTRPPTPEELEVLEEWLAGGGILLYAAMPFDPTLELLGLTLITSRVERGAGADSTAGEARKQAAQPQILSSWPAIRHSFADSSRVFIENDVVVLDREVDGRARVLSWPVGEGRVVAWSDVGPLRNGALREDREPAVLFAREAARAAEEAGVLSFDEFHHGYRGEGDLAGATLDYLRNAGPGRMALQLGAAVLGYLLLMGWRFGSPVPLTPPSRRSPVEHLEALAGIYRQANARRLARRLLVAQLARRLGHPPPRNVEEEERLLEYVGADGAGEEVEEGVRRIREELGRGDRVDLVKLAHSVDELVAEVKKR